MKASMKLTTINKELKELFQERKQLLRDFRKHGATNWERLREVQKRQDKLLRVRNGKRLRGELGGEE